MRKGGGKEDKGRKGREKEKRRGEGGEREEREREREEKREKRGKKYKKLADHVHYHGTLARDAHLPVRLHVHTVVRLQWHMHYCQVKVTGSFLKCRVDGAGSNL